MNSPKKKYKVKLNDGNGRLIYYGGNELADAQDLLGQPVVNVFWQFMGAAECEDPEMRGRKLLEILGDKEILILMHMGIRGGIKDGGGKEFSMKQVGDLIYTDIEHKSEYIDAIIGSLSIAIFGKSPESLAEEAKEKKETEAENDTEEKALPNPT